MQHDRPRWRFRISTLMLLIIILALTFELVSDWRKREQQRRRVEALRQRFIAEFPGGVRSQVLP